MEIKISQKSLDAFKKEKELIPAPIDEKNVTSDWIECVFDNQSCVWGKKSAVGYINGEPVIAAWDSNMLLWKFPITRDLDMSVHLAILKDRLERWNEERRFVEHFNVLGNMLMQKFYWKNED